MNRHTNPCFGVYVMKEVGGPLVFIRLLVLSHTISVLLPSDLPSPVIR